MEVDFSQCFIKLQAFWGFGYSINDSKGMVLKGWEFPQVISRGAANTHFIKPNPGIPALADTKKNVCLSDQCTADTGLYVIVLCHLLQEKLETAAPS